MSLLRSRHFVESCVSHMQHKHTKGYWRYAYKKLQ